MSTEGTIATLGDQDPEHRARTERTLMATKLRRERSAKKLHWLNKA